MFDHIDRRNYIRAVGVSLILVWLAIIVVRKSSTPAAENSIDPQSIVSPNPRREAADWQTPINFYGKAVDQTGSPITGAFISFIWTDISAAGTSKQATKTGADGTFSLEGARGKHLHVSVSHPDYHSTKESVEGFFYAGVDVPFVGRPEEPVLFSLVKRGRAEPLVTLAGDRDFRFYQLGREGELLEISLESGKSTTAGKGDIIIRRWADFTEQKARRRYGWKYEITIRDGGLSMSTNEFDFVAPTSGFSETISIDMPATERTWKRQLRFRAFMKLKNGNYGRLELEILSWARDGVGMKAYINPTGSRNLEFDTNLNNLRILR